MSDISNRELREVLISVKDSNIAQTASLKECISNNSVNIKQLNDNQVFHNKELIKFNLTLETWSKLLPKFAKWGVIVIFILLSIILVMSGYKFLWEVILGWIS